MRHLDLARTLAALVATVGLAACDATPLAPSPRADQPNLASPPAVSGPATPASAAPTPSLVPTATPTAAGIVLSGTWVRPKAGATLTAYTTTLSAKPTAAGPGVTTFSKVVFFATWHGGNKTTMCTATVPDDRRVWSCTVDLVTRGVPPGTVTLSFDVHGVGVATARSPGGSRRVTYAVPPPKPTNLRFEQLEEPDFETGDGTATHRVRWTSPPGYASEFLLYETYECPRPSTRRNSGKPCFVAGTPVDTAQLELLAGVSGGARSVEVRLTEAECGPSHGSILLRARSASGRSAFAIVEAAPIIWLEPGDMMC